MPRIVEFRNAQDEREERRDKVKDVLLKRKAQRLSKQDIFSEIYYYGDYTKMNMYLVNRYQIPLDLNAQIINPGINEIQYGNVQQVLDSLHGYLSVTVDAVNDLKVFPLDKLLASLEQYAIEFLSL